MACTWPSHSSVNAVMPSLAARRTRSWVAPTLLLAALTAFYVPSARNDFIYDDIQVIQKQQAPRSAADFARIFASSLSEM